MRIDQFINKICIVKTRSIANKACGKGLVKINDQVAKASAIVKPDDIIAVELNGYKTVIKVTQIPQGNVSKKSALDYYELLEREALELDV